METILQGIAAADGYAKSELVVFQPQDTVELGNVPFRNVETELAALKTGTKRYVEHLQRLIDSAKENNDETTVDILDAYTEILADEEIENEIIASIKNESVAAIVAVDRIFRATELEMQQLDNDYARQRSEDIKHIGQMLIRAIVGYELNITTEFPSNGFILCGRELTPADTAQIPKDRLLGIITETGGKTSHVALLAQNLGIPAVVGLQNLLDNINISTSKQHVLLDGCEGTVILQPTLNSAETFLAKQTLYKENIRQLETLRDLPAETENGKAIQLLANIGCLDDIAPALKWGAEGVGLFRTEFLFTQSVSMPDEETQFAYYRRLVEEMRGKPVTIRTLDIGGDKPLAYLPLPKEQNPFLGWRACRMYSAFPDLILTQLRAIFRASMFGNVRIMVPMISSVEEVDEMLMMVTEAKSQLSKRAIEYADSVPLGIMVETPAAVMMIEELLKPIDFCSIGTNDLTQYTLAVDRGNEKVASLYDSFHPAVLRLIAQVVRAAAQLGKSVSLCGELGGESLAVPFLLGIGLTQFSMSPVRIPILKQRIRNWNCQHSESFTAECLALSTASEVKQFLLQR